MNVVNALFKALSEHLVESAEENTQLGWWASERRTDPGP
jgi:hypothetical protein